MGDVLRSDHFSRNWSKRHDCVEHVTLNKFRAPAGVELCVFISIPHPGSLFVRQPNLRNTLEMGGFWEQSSRRMRFLALMLWMPSCTKGVLRFF